MATQKIIYYDKVLMPIEVAHGNFCFGEGRCCGHYDNYGGHRTCDLNFYPLKEDEKGRILKPETCKNLKEAK